MQTSSMWRRPARCSLLGLWMLVAATSCSTNSGKDVKGAMPPVWSRCVAIGEQEVFVESAGSGPAVVLVHGGGLDRRMWDDQFRALASGYFVARYDLPGFGESEASDAPFSQVEVLAGVLEHLDLSAAHLVGLSYGASCVIDFALAHPERVQSMVLAAPGLSGYPWSPEWTQRYADLFRRAQQEGPEAAVEHWLQDPHLQPAMERSPLDERLRELHQDNQQMYVQPAPAQPEKQPAIDRLSEIEIPTLVVIGDRDVTDTQEVAKLLDEQVGGATVLWVAGAGHIVNMEEPVAFNQGLMSFLTERDG